MSGPKWLRHQEVGETVYISPHSILVNEYGVGRLLDTTISHTAPTGDAVMEVTILSRDTVTCKLPYKLRLRCFPHLETPKGTKIVAIQEFTDFDGTVHTTIPGKYRRKKSRGR